MSGCALFGHPASSVFSQEVMEIFVAQYTDATKVDDPIDYDEFEINPKGFLYHARIHNPYKNGTDKVGRREKKRKERGRGVPLAWPSCVVSCMYVWHTLSNTLLLALCLLCSFVTVLLATDQEQHHAQLRQLHRCGRDV